MNKPASRIQITDNKLAFKPSGSLQYLSPALNTTIGGPEFPKKKSNPLHTSPYALPQIKYSKRHVHTKSKPNLRNFSKKTQIAHLTKSISFEPKDNLNQTLNISVLEASQVEDPESDQTFSRLSHLFKTIPLNAKNDEKYEACKLIFSEIIISDKSFASFLHKIKQYYEEYIKLQISEKEKLKGIISQTEIANSLLSDDAKRLVSENKDLSKKISALNAKIEEILAKTNKDLNLKNTSNHENYWKNISKENQILKDNLSTMEHDLKYYKHSTNKLSKLLLVIKSKGLPIEEIYNTEVKKKKPLPKYSGDDSAKDDTDMENIISPKKLSFRKRSNIPALNFSLVEPNSFTSDSQSESSEKFISKSQ